MLLDPKWDKEIKIDEVAQVLLDAADYIDKHGWCQNKLEDDDGRVCVMGALYRVNTPWSAYSKLFRHLSVNIKVLDVPFWNDAHGRTKEEVVSVLRKVAYL